MPATHVHQRLGRRLIVGIALILAAAGIGAGAVAAKDKPNDCHSVIAGTYLIPSGSITNLSKDGSISGSLSETSQALGGQGDMFMGSWQCDGTTITGRDFRWVDNPAGRQISRVDWQGTFEAAGGGSIDVIYTFYRLAEDATAAELLAASPLFDDHKILVRIAAP
jgi:hypothetical protein